MPPKEVQLRVRIQPRASRNALRMEPDGRLRVSVTAPAVDNAANKALVALVAKELGVAKRDVDLVKGGKSRDKALLVKGLDLADVKRVLGTDEGSGR